MASAIDLEGPRAKMRLKLKQKKADTQAKARLEFKQNLVFGVFFEFEWNLSLNPSQIESEFEFLNLIRDAGTSSSCPAIHS